MSKIYTRTGDKGTTGLIGGTRVLKSDLRVESYGTIDELNAHLGLLQDQLQEKQIDTILPVIQERLFVIGAALACDPVKAPKYAIPDLVEADIALLEKTIDRLNEGIPKMTHFILPGGHPYISQAHIARCVCRRAERRCVDLVNNKDEVTTASGESVNATVHTDQAESNQLSIEQTHLRIVQYLNRLSDYLFVLSRYIGKTLDIPEIPWVPRNG